MNLNPASRTRILADMTVEIDPTGSTVEISVDGTWYPATWQDTPVPVGSKWAQTARTTDYFAGPTATPAGAVVLSLGKHKTRTRVTKGGDVLVADSSPIDVN